MISTGVDNTGKIIDGTELSKLFANSNMFKGLTSAEIDRNMNKYETDALKYLSFLKEYRQIGAKDSGYTIGDDVTEEMGFEGTGATATVVGEGKVEITTASGRKYIMSGVTSDLDNKSINTTTATIDFSDEDSNLYDAGKARLALRYSSNIAAPEERKIVDDNFDFYDADKDGKITAADARILLRAGAKLEEIWDVDDYNELDSAMKSGKYNETYDFNHDNKIDKTDLILFLDERFGKLKQYATGGLANFTGPAWLDGTKSKPELVLNARDTENFI